MFRHVPDAHGGDVEGSAMGDVGAIEGNGALPGGVEAHDRLERRRLAGSVTAQERNDRSLWNVDGDTFEHMELFDERVNAVQPQEAHVSAPSS